MKTVTNNFNCITNAWQNLTEGMAGKGEDLSNTKYQGSDSINWKKKDKNCALELSSSRESVSHKGI